MRDQAKKCRKHARLQQSVTVTHRTTEEETQRGRRHNSIKSKGESRRNKKEEKEEAMHV